MGVDARLFDERSRECLYFDREHNLCRCDWVDAAPEEWLYDKLRGGRRASAADVLEMVRLCRTEHEEHSPYWTDAIEEFVQARPDGRFFVVTDHDEPWMGEVMRSGDYRDVEPSDAIG